jgi:hypothetical protein
MKTTFATLATAAVLVLTAAPAFAEDTPLAPADVQSEPAAPPAPSAASVVGNGGAHRPCGWVAWVEPMLVRFHPCVSDWAVEGDAAERPTGVVHEVEYDYELGFRAGVAHRKPESLVGWFVQVTWASAEASHRATEPAGGGIALTHGSPDGADFGIGASATHVSEIDYIVLDAGAILHVEMGKEGAAKIWGGLRVAKIDMDVDENVFNAAGAVVESLVASTDMLGFGIAVGAELRWNVCGPWSFYGKAATGILLSNIDGRVLDTVPGATLTNVHNEIDRITPFIEMGVGVGWGCERFLGSCIGLQADLGFELTNWFNVLDPLTFVDDVKDSALDEENDDLGLSAFSLRVTLTF